MRKMSLGLLYPGFEELKENYRKTLPEKHKEQFLWAISLPQDLILENIYYEKYHSYFDGGNGATVRRYYGVFDSFITKYPDIPLDKALEIVDEEFMYSNWSDRQLKKVVAFMDKSIIERFQELAEYECWMEILNYSENRDNMCLEDEDFKIEDSASDETNSDNKRYPLIDESYFDDDYIKKIYIFFISKAFIEKISFETFKDIFYGKILDCKINWRIGYGALSYFFEYGWSCKIINPFFINPANETVNYRALNDYFINKGTELNYNSFREGRSKYQRILSNDPNAIIIKEFLENFY